MLTLRSITNPQDPALERLGRLQNAVYADPNMLIPASMFGQLIQWSFPERQNFIVVAEKEGDVLGGAVFHLFAEVGAGFSSFLGVSLAAQGQGVSSKLHHFRWQTLEDALKREPEGLFIDVVNPARMSATEFEAEEKVGSSPLRRRRVFNHLGFKQVNVEYVQPSSPPITNMDLLFYSPARPSSIPTDLVVDTMKVYWQPWLGEEKSARAAEELRARAGGDVLELIDP
ncbi:MAG: GNAT family N-acetyltransferase [Pseudopedobacter sp.]|nr:GNAT family N-acetyltransferase [Deinococcales bacterium]